MEQGRGEKRQKMEQGKVWVKWGGDWLSKMIGPRKGTRPVAAAHINTPFRLPGATQTCDSYIAGHEWCKAHHVPSSHVCHMVLHTQHSPNDASAWQHCTASLEFKLDWAVHLLSACKGFF